MNVAENALSEDVAQSDLHQYAALIGFDLSVYPFLEPLIAGALHRNEELPPDWETVYSEDDPDVPMFWNRTSDVVTVTHPIDDAVRERCRLEVEEYERSQLTEIVISASASDQRPPQQRQVTDEFAAGEECRASEVAAVIIHQLYASPQRTVDMAHHFYDLSPREIAQRVKARLEALALAEAPMLQGTTLSVHLDSIDVPHPSVNEAEDKVAHFEQEVIRLRRELEELESQGHRREQQYESEKKKLVEVLKLQAAQAAMKVLHDKLKPPNEFYCPILNEVMKDPVVTVDGFTYEREAIATWFKTSSRSPCTNLTLPSQNLIPNLALRQQIEAHFATMRYK